MINRSTWQKSPRRKKNHTERISHTDRPNSTESKNATEKTSHTGSRTEDSRINSNNNRTRSTPKINKPKNPNNKILSLKDQNTPQKQLKRKKLPTITKNLVNVNTIKNPA